jgi:hypothetical protein
MPADCDPPPARTRRRAADASRRARRQPQPEPGRVANGGKATQLQRATEGEARIVQDQLVLRFESELEALLRRADRQIAALVRQLAAEDGRLVRTRARRSAGRSGCARTSRRAIGGRLPRSPTRRQRPVRRARLEGARTTTRSRPTPRRLTAVDVDSITALKELRSPSCSTGATACRSTPGASRARRRARAAAGRRLVSTSATCSTPASPRARTLYDTAVSTFSRQVGLLHTTGEADELFYYAGPVDRDASVLSERVGKVFSRAEIDQMDNGQLPDVLVTGGGYNCRHTFKAVSVLDDELRQLHETGGRLPHVRASSSTRSSSRRRPPDARHCCARHRQEARRAPAQRRTADAGDRPARRTPDPHAHRTADRRARRTVPAAVAGYAKQKAEAGLSPVPDLTVSGRMLNDMARRRGHRAQRLARLHEQRRRAPRSAGARKGLKASRPRARSSSDRARSAPPTRRTFTTRSAPARSGVVREFFALSSSDEDQIEAALDTYFDRAMGE